MPRTAKSFRSVLKPHRSLSRKGFLILMGVLTGFNFTAGSVFYLLGAWPVAPFMMLDVALVWWAFRKNYADGLQAEHIEVTEHELILARLDPHKRREEIRFTRGWVKVELEEDHARELIGGLFLRSRGVRTEIGKFLPARDRKAFASVLRGALAKSQT